MAEAGVTELKRGNNSSDSSQKGAPMKHALWILALVGMVLIIVFIPEIDARRHLGLNGHTRVVQENDVLPTRVWVYPDGERCGETWLRPSGFWYVYAEPTWANNKEFKSYDIAALYLNRVCHGK